MYNYGHGYGHGHCPNSQVSPIVCPPEYRFHECYTTQEVPYVHPIVNVNRHNVIGVPQHYYTETTEDVMGNFYYPGGPPMGRGGFGRRRWC